MLDTSYDIQQKQLEIIFSKTPQERFLIGAETINFGRTMLVSGIKQKNPNISDIDLKIALFKKYYSTIFKPEDIGKIILSMTSYYNLKK